MPEQDRSRYVVSFLERMTYDIGQKNPDLARRIKAYYVTPDGTQLYSEGLGDITRELIVLDRKAKRGEVDLSKVEIEGVIVGVTMAKFAPSQNSASR